MANQSNFTSITLIAERSEATPGLWNNALAIINQNFAQINTAGTVFNVKAFGGVGDGVADDTAAMTATFAAAATYLGQFGVEQARAVVELAGGQYRIGSTITLPQAFGLSIQNGAIKASSAFAGGYLLATKDGANQPTGLMTIRDVTFDAQRIPGVGGVLLQAHRRITVDNCYFKRANTYALRSINGSGLANELIVSHSRFDEWPLDDSSPAPSLMSSTAISVEHNDSVVAENIIGSGNTGITIDGQYDIVQGNHTYVGYRAGGIGLWVPSLCGIYLSLNAVHTYVSGNYIDSCRLRMDNPFNVRVLNNLFLQNTSQTTAVFIESHLTASGAALTGVSIAYNGFQNLGTAQLSMLTVTGGNQFNAPNTDLRTNCIDYNASGSSCSLVRLDDLVGGTTGIMVYDSGNTSGNIALNWMTKPNWIVTLIGNATLSVASIPIGRDLDLTVNYVGNAVTWPTGVTWSGGMAPPSSTLTGMIDHVRFSRINSTQITGSVLMRGDGSSIATNGIAGAPAFNYASETSLGFYRSGVSTIAPSYGTLNLASNAVRLSMRTLPASAVTLSAANTNVAVNEIVLTIGGASGASLCVSSGGTTYIFSSALSAKNT